MNFHYQEIFCKIRPKNVQNIAKSCDLFHTISYSIIQKAKRSIFSTIILTPQDRSLIWMKVTQETNLLLTFIEYKRLISSCSKDWHFSREQWHYFLSILANVWNNMCRVNQYGEMGVRPSKGGLPPAPSLSSHWSLPIWKKLMCFSHIFLCIGATFTQIINMKTILDKKNRAN